MNVGTGGNLDLSREYHKKLFGALFYSWWNCPLSETYIYSLTNTLVYAHEKNTAINYTSYRR